MAFSHSPKIVTDGLVLCLDAANTKSYPGTGTTWKDLSGNGNNGTLTNGPTFDSGNGGSIDFDGSNDYVDIGSPITGSGVMSMEFWINVNNITSDDRLISNTAGSNFSVRFNGSALEVWGPGWQGIITNTGTLRTWTQYVINFLGSSTVVGFKNGVEGNTQTLNYNVGNSGTGTIRLGYPLDGIYGGYYDGSIGNFKIYNRALTATEIQQNYNATKGRFGL